MISIRINHKAFSGQDPVIQNFKLDILKGEIVTLIGPSGSGKTTLLNLVAGLDQSYNGFIHLPDDDNRTALMFQEARLMPWLTVLDNVLLVNPTVSDAKNTALSLLDKVGLREHADTFPNALSGGMKKRVALARAFMYQPNVLLLDEPFASLDKPAAQGLRDLVIALAQQHATTVVYVTHDLNEAVSIADRVVLLSPNPMTIRSEEEILLPRPRHIDSPAVNLLCQQLRNCFPDLLSAPDEYARQAAATRETSC